MNKRFLGKAGEDLAESYLQALGHTILERGFRCKPGEIDIISFHDGVIHFVEVKTRTGLDFGRPVESVTKKKLVHINNTAQCYIGLLEKKPGFDVDAVDYTIDVIEILINHIEGVV